MFVRWLKIGVFVGLLLVGACGGGGGNGTTPPPEQKSPLKIVSFVASPTVGPSPLGVTFTATVSGGVLPVAFFWDFNKDGATDTTTGPSGSRVATVYHEFLLRAEDSGVGSSTYEVTVTVVDDDGKSVVSDPLIITVTSQPTFSVQVSVLSDFVQGFDQAGNPIYAYLSGKPVYFRATVEPLGGAPPDFYTFAWDFDGNGTIDSTLKNAQYTFTLVGGAESMPFRPTLTVTDSKGLKVVWTPPPGTEDIYVIRQEVVPPPSGIPKVIVSAFPVIEPGNIIHIYYNSQSEIVDEQRPKLAVTASVDILHPGTPPYGFAWDFTSDGVVDARTPSAGVPYYDPDLNIAVNPYLLKNVYRKEFQLTLDFVDASGYKERLTYRVIVTDRAFEQEVNPLTGTVVVDTDGDEDFDVPPAGASPESQMYADVSAVSTDVPTDGVYGSYVVRFKVTAKGSTGYYDFQIDPIGNGAWAWAGADIGDGKRSLLWDPQVTGNPVVVELNNDNASVDAYVEISETGDTATFSITYWDGIDSGTPIPGAYLPGYKAVRLKIRALDRPAGPGAMEVASIVLNAPVSLVSVAERPFSANSDEPVGRTDFGFVGVTLPNGQRRAFIIGGMDQNNALRSVQLITEDLQPSPSTSYDPATITLTDRLPLLDAAGQLGAGFVADVGTPGTPRIFALGGFNNPGGAISTVSSLPPYDGGRVPTVPWIMEGTIGNNDTQIRLMETVSFANALMLFGGLEGDPGYESVSPRVWVFVPGSDSGSGGFWTDSHPQTSPMPTPRYDFATVLWVEEQTAYVYAIGGRANDGRSLTTVERMKVSEPASGSWEALPDMSVPRAGCTAEVINGKIYVFGGAIYPSAGFGTPELVDSVEVFNPDYSFWSFSKPLPVGAVASLESTVFASEFVQNAPPDTVWVYGGLKEDGYNTSLLEFLLEDRRNF